MGITVGRYSFEGPFTDVGWLQRSQGVYAILCQAWVGSPTVLDIGESEDVRQRVEGHDRKSCWQRNCRATVSVAVLYTPGFTADQRRYVERELRALYGPICGER